LLENLFRSEVEVARIAEVETALTISSSPVYTADEAKAIRRWLLCAFFDNLVVQ
jgi:hypothetical protein